MTIKNYVICAHRRIKSTQWVWKDTSAEGDIYENYYKMALLSLGSARHFLEGDWEYILFDEEIDNINLAMPLNNDRIYELWHKEPCNILWVGPDVQFKKPTKIFGEFKEFRLFNWTDPKNWDRPNQYDLRFDYFFNNDLQYYPSTMSPEIWEIERSMRAEWLIDDSMDSYNNQQLIHNCMFWSQRFTWEDAHRPHLFYQAHWLPWQDISVMDEWNQSKMEDAHVIHWHGSRDSNVKLQVMQQLNDSFEIPIITELK